MSGMVESGSDMPIVECPELLPDKSTLIMAMLDDDKSTRIDVPGCTGYDAVEALCSVMAPVQRQPGFITEFLGRQPGARIVNIRRIA